MLPFSQLLSVNHVIFHGTGADESREKLLNILERLAVEQSTPRVRVALTVISISVGLFVLYHWQDVTKGIAEETSVVRAMPSLFRSRIMHCF